MPLGWKSFLCNVLSLPGRVPRKLPTHRSLNQHHVIQYHDGSGCTLRAWACNLIRESNTIRSPQVSIHASSSLPTRFILARTLFQKTQVGEGVGPEVPLDAPLAFTLDAYLSGASYAGKKTKLVLFINERPVDCPPLKRALEAVYGAALPKGAKPWLLLDLRLPPRHVEVNMHPTKREVGFLHQVRLGKGGGGGALCWGCWQAGALYWG